MEIERGSTMEAAALLGLAEGELCRYLPHSGADTRGKRLVIDYIRAVNRYVERVDEDLSDRAGGA